MEISKSLFFLKMAFEFFHIVPIAADAGVLLMIVLSAAGVERHWVSKPSGVKSQTRSLAFFAKLSLFASFAALLSGWKSESR